jgi:hypothetical protein
VKEDHRQIGPRREPAVDRAQRALMISETVAELEKMGLEAVSVFRGALEDEDVGVRLRAARAVLDFMLKGAEMERKIRELDGIEEQIEELREIVESSAKGAVHWVPKKSPGEEDRRPPRASLPSATTLPSTAS